MSEFDEKKMYLGRFYDKNNELTDEKLLYNPSDLNTHGVILGMTGSGKTGLGILMLEEIARKGIPAMIIDPKGDLTNLLLHFGNMQGQDIAPFLDPEAPGRAGTDMESFADEKAKEWRQGQEKWGFTEEDIASLNNVEYTVFTPGSTIGNPVNIMDSFAAPDTMWNEKNEEGLREEISTSVTALLSLVGMTNIDPIKSKEHILLSNIIEFYWRADKDVDLAKLINAITEPPFTTLGAMDVDSIYSAKERKKLALQINNFLASPTFRNWNLGPNLDIDGLMMNKEGKPRFNVFYIQHLSDQERMFFVTMLYSQVESWMRTQPGTGNLRLVVYFDEMAGYIPPNGNPAAKSVMLRLLKQGRAYGVSMLLASQNPIDIDYKGLSNAGTWFVGHLQTEQDKNRLIDGLSTTEGEINRSQADRLISSLKKRAFLYMNVHESGLRVMTTRWCLNYLAGPLTRTTIPMLTEKGLNTVYTVKDARAAKRFAAGMIDVEPEAEEYEAEEALPTYTIPSYTETVLPDEAADLPEYADDGTHPAIPASIDEYYVPVTKDRSDTGASDEAVLKYVPSWIAQADIDFVDAKHDISSTATVCTEISGDDEPKGTAIRWSRFTRDPYDLTELLSGPENGDTPFVLPPLWMMNAQVAQFNRNDCIDWLCKNQSVSVMTNERLNIYQLAGNEDERQDFLQQCNDKVEEMIQKETDKIMKDVESDTRVVMLRDKAERAQQELDDLQKRIQGSKIASLVEGIQSFSRSIGASTRKTDLEKAQQKVDEANEKLTDRLTELELKGEKAVGKVRDKYSEILDKSREIRIYPSKRDVTLSAFGICWMPFFVEEDGVSFSAF